jgi:hypothetical protein
MHYLLTKYRKFCDKDRNDIKEIEENEAPQSTYEHSVPTAVSCG